MYMRTDKRTEDTPWQSIDLMTDECVGWYSTDMAAYSDAGDRSIIVHYRPKRKKVSK